MDRGRRKQIRPRRKEPRNWSTWSTIFLILWNRALNTGLCGARGSSVRTRCLPCWMKNYPAKRSFISSTPHLFRASQKWSMHTCSAGINPQAANLHADQATRSGFSFHALAIYTNATQSYNQWVMEAAVRLPV